jgi:hypothetical protein
MNQMGGQLSGWGMPAPQQQPVDEAANFDSLVNEMNGDGSNLAR